MLEIDASFGYGQVLRTAIALSTLTLKQIKVTNIRKGRAKPGLMPQHLAGVKAAGEFCNAEIKGLKIGSTEIEFVPKKHNFQSKKIDIGTAGQISLLLQTLMPLLLFADNEVSLEMIGGTSGLGAPTLDYLKNVTFSIVSKLGVKLSDIEVVKHGFYPKGQGLVKAGFHPNKRLDAIELADRGKVKSVRGISVAGSLPKHIADRQAGTAERILNDHGIDDVQIESIAVKTASPGTCITLWAECENTVLGYDSIGEIGKPAEKVGEECASSLLKSIGSEAALDKWMSDQVLPFLALAKGRSEVRVEEFTDHVKSNIRIIENVLNVKFEIDEKSKIISVDGIGFSADKI